MADNLVNNVRFLTRKQKPALQKTAYVDIAHAIANFPEAVNEIRQAIDELESLYSPGVQDNKEIVKESKKLHNFIEKRLSNIAKFSNKLKTEVLVI